MHSLCIFPRHSLPESSLEGLLTVLWRSLDSLDVMLSQHQQDILAALTTSELLMLDVVTETMRALRNACAGCRHNQDILVEG